MPSLPAAPNYQINPVHRNGTYGKSQWTVNTSAELVAFDQAWTSGWCAQDVGWGLYTPAGSPEYLGVAQDHATLVFVAKFVADAQGCTWHGYPADHRRNQHDIPSESIRKSWLDARLLPLPKIRKLGKGQRCTL